MAEMRDEVRDDLMALLAASRELAPDTDAHLASAFLDRLQRQAAPRRDTGYWQVSKRAASAAFVGVVWLVAAAILLLVPYYNYTHDHDLPDGYYSLTVPAVLIVAVALSLMVWLANMTDWRLPHARIILPPAREDA